MFWKITRSIPVGFFGRLKRLNAGLYMIGLFIIPVVLMFGTCQLLVLNNFRHSMHADFEIERLHLAKTITNYFNQELIQGQVKDVQFKLSLLNGTFLFSDASVKRGLLFSGETKEKIILKNQYTKDIFFLFTKNPLFQERIDRFFKIFIAVIAALNIVMIGVLVFIFKRKFYTKIVKQSKDKKMSYGELIYQINFDQMKNAEFYRLKSQKEVFDTVAKSLHDLAPVAEILSDPEMVNQHEIFDICLKRVSNGINQLLEMRKKEFFSESNKETSRNKFSLIKTLRYASLSDFANILEENCKIIERRYKDKIIIESIKRDDDLFLDCPIHIFSDAIFNLLDNALKYKTSGSVILQMNQRQRWLEIEIINESEPFSPELIKNMFLNNVTGKNNNGIGLSSTYEALNEHKAHLQFFENEGRAYSRIYLYFLSGNNNSVDYSTIQQKGVRNAEKR
jgi:hypothetical protein